MLSLFAVGVIINYKYRPNEIKRQARKFINKEENTDLIKERQLEFSDAGISCSYQKSNSHLEWSKVVKYATTKDLFFLYTSSESAYAIPKRIFSTQQEIDSFDKYLTEKIPLSASFRSL